MRARAWRAGANLLQIYTGFAYQGAALIEEILRCSARMIDPELIEQYQRDGAVCIRQLFARDEIATLRAGIDLNLSSLSPRAIVASGADDPGRFVEDFCNWQDNPHYRRFIFDSALAETAGRLMQSTTARLYHDHMLTKEPGTRQTTPWHQDQPYYNVEGRQNASFWIPVDPVSRDSTLELVAGSHLGPWLMPRTFMDAAGQMVSGGHARRTCRTSTRPAITSASWAGNCSRATPYVSTC